MRAYVLAALCIFALALPVHAQGLPAGNAALLMFSAFAGAIGRPLIAWLVSLADRIPNDVAGALTVLFFAVVYLTGWALLGGKGGAPADLISWGQGALDAVGMGSIVMSAAGASRAVTKSP